MSLSVLDAVRLFSRRVTINQAFPRELRGPHVQTRVAHLKNRAASQRASWTRAAKCAKAFLKNWRRLTHSGRHSNMRPRDAIPRIANDAPIGLEWLSRALKRHGVDHRECCLGRDFPPIYQVEGRMRTAQKIPGNLYGQRSYFPSLCRVGVSNPGKARKAAVPRRRMGNSKAKT